MGKEEDLEEAERKYREGVAADKKKQLEERKREQQEE